jgi:hypothetical protein
VGKIVCAGSENCLGTGSNTVIRVSKPHFYNGKRVWDFISKAKANLTSQNDGIFINVDGISYPTIGFSISG